MTPPFAIEVADAILTEGAVDTAAMIIASCPDVEKRRMLADHPGGPSSRDLLRAAVRAALTNLVAAGRIASPVSPSYICLAEATKPTKS